MNAKKRLFTLLCAILLLVGTVFVFAGGKQGMTAERRGTFVIGVLSECSNVAAWRLRSPQERVSWGPIYETLFKVDDDGKVQGYLAESLESNYNELTYTVKLRQDVHFSDGSKLDAAS